MARLYTKEDILDEMQSWGMNMGRARTNVQNALSDENRRITDEIDGYTIWAINGKIFANL